MNGPSQAFELAFEERALYLYARITSRAITLERSEKYLNEVASRCRKLGVTRLLIERHIPQTLSNVDAYRAINSLVDMLPLGLRIAFVDSHLNNRKRLEFGMRAARSRQIHAEVFGTVAEAEKWLLKSDS